MYSNLSLWTNLWTSMYFSTNKLLLSLTFLKATFEFIYVFLMLHIKSYYLTIINMESWTVVQNWLFYLFKNLILNFWILTRTYVSTCPNWMHVASNNFVFNNRLYVYCIYQNIGKNNKLPADKFQNRIVTDI